MMSSSPVVNPVCWGSASPILLNLTKPYNAMRESGTGKYRLAKKLGWKLPQFDRVFTLRYRSRFDQIEKALAAVGRKVVISTTSLQG